MPKIVERWKWFTVDPERVNQRPTRTRYHLSEAEAFERFGPDVQRDPLSKQLQEVYEEGERPPPNRR